MQLDSRRNDLYVNVHLRLSTISIGKKALSTEINDDLLKSVVFNIEGWAHYTRF